MFRCEMEHFPDIRFANCRVRSQVGEQGRAVVQLDLSEAHYWFLDWDQLSSAHSSVRTLHTLIACLARHHKHHKPLTLQSHMRPGQTAPASDFKLCQNTNPHPRTGDMQLPGNRGWDHSIIHTLDIVTIMSHCKINPGSRCNCIFNCGCCMQVHTMSCHRQLLS